MDEIYLRWSKVNMRQMQKVSHFDLMVKVKLHTVPQFCLSHSPNMTTVQIVKETMFNFDIRLGQVEKSVKINVLEVFPRVFVKV